MSDRPADTQIKPTGGTGGMSTSGVEDMLAPTAQGSPLPPDALAEAEPAPAVEKGALSQWQLIRRRFSRHTLAVVALNMLVFLYLLALFAEVGSPYTPAARNLDYQYCPPQLIRWNPSEGLHVHAMQLTVAPVTLRRTYTRRSDMPVRLSLFARGEPYRLWGLIPMERRVVGLSGGQSPEGAQPQAALEQGGTVVLPTFYFLGADKYGRDIFSRIVHGARVSLSVGLIGITFTFILGMTIGGISGYVGGRTDNLIQRGIEILSAFPQLPLWLALAAMMPSDWSPLRTYFAITLVLSVLGWTGLARVVRGKILSLREEDYAVAARLLGASHGRVLFRHLIPGFTSHIIVALSLSVPAMILAETSLSFLGLGLRPPIVSWGVMLQDCMDIQAVRYYPWLLLPVVFIVTAVLSFNFVGDGLRDAADPYSAR